MPARIAQRSIRGGDYDSEPAAIEAQSEADLPA
jgi:hypothetical protein